MTDPLPPFLPLLLPLPFFPSFLCVCVRVGATIVVTIFCSRTGASLYMISNLYDYVPYLPTFEGVVKGTHALMYEGGAKAVTAIAGGRLPSFTPPSGNVYMPPLGYHSILAQYLPLTRGIVGSGVAQGAGGCELLCDVGQCGMWKCKDTCEGVL